MKNAILLFFLISFFLGLFNACKNDQDKIIPSEYITVIYDEGPCCQNLRAITNIELPDQCESAYNILFADNLAAFNIPQNFQTGDSLQIKFDFTLHCEAEANEYDCLVTCDIRHGVPINITAIK